MTMLTLKDILIRFGGAVLGIALVAYIIHQGWALIIGPRIVVTTPVDGLVATEQVIRVTGTAKNTTYISLNGMPILIDERGNFDIEEALSPGSSVITLYARDRFGNEYVDTRTVTYHPPQPSAAPPEAPPQDGAPSSESTSPPTDTPSAHTTKQNTAKQNTSSTGQTQ